MEYTCDLWLWFDYFKGHGKPFYGVVAFWKYMNNNFLGHWKMGSILGLCTSTTWFTYKMSHGTPNYHSYFYKPSIWHLLTYF